MHIIRALLDLQGMREDLAGDLLIREVWPLYSLGLQ